jgi:transcriptional regulator with PAS, ATPase and Fis domain
LYNYNWPGNVRELKNIIERLVIFSESDQIGEDEIYVLDFDKEKDSLIPGEGILIDRIMPLKAATQKVREILIKKALEKYGSVKKASEILEITPVTVHRLKKKNSTT